MARNRIDEKIFKLMKRSVASRHRCMFFICGANARDQIPALYYHLRKCRVDAGLEEPSVLWTFKREVGIAGHHQRKKIKFMRQKYTVGKKFFEEDLYNHFLLSANPKYCHYSKTEHMLGQSFSMLIAQDFEALTPNTLARIVECVEGGGACIFLLPSNLHDLCELPIDAHARYVTEFYNTVVPLFYKRMIHTLANCSSCVVIDDTLKEVLMPKRLKITAAMQTAALEIPDYLNIRSRSIFSMCRTNDQVTALTSLHASLFGTSSVVSLTAGRGRGKSAVLGLAISLALVSGRGSVVLTSPHVDNVQTLFAFVIKGLQAIEWRDGHDFKVIRNDSHLITRIQLLRNNHKRHQVKYLLPVETSKGGAAELLVIDEAAAIPLPLVKEWMKPSYSIFMASTIQGYEGTGRSLSLKLLKELRDPGAQKPGLIEVELKEAIRYSDGDPIESWLEQLLCLRACNCHIFQDQELPPAQNCELYFVNRDVLFSGEQVAEEFLLQLVSLFVSSHYKNTPNDLLMMADAPAHRLFCLMEPHTLDKPICAIQIAIEGGLSRETCHRELVNGRRGAGDLIPWTLAQQFQDETFPCLKSARIIRIATHHDFQGKGYGSRALQLLLGYYASPPRNYPLTSNRLLWRLDEMPFLETLVYLGVSFGLTPELLNFWKRAGFIPLYIRQTASEVTGEHSCVMVNAIRGGSWIQDFADDFQERFKYLLPTAFKELPATTVNMVIKNTRDRLKPNGPVPRSELRAVEARDRSRLYAYCRGQVDFHLILDILPKLVSLLPQLNYVHRCVIVSVGLQGKSMDQAAEEMKLEPSVVMGFFRKAVSKLMRALEKKVIRDQLTIRHSQSTECISNIQSPSQTEV